MGQLAPSSREISARQRNALRLMSLPDCQVRARASLDLGAAFRLEHVAVTPKGAWLLGTFGEALLIDLPGFEVRRYLPL